MIVDLKGNAMNSYTESLENRLRKLHPQDQKLFRDIVEVLDQRASAVDCWEELAELLLITITESGRLVYSDV